MKSMQLCAEVHFKLKTFDDGKIRVKPKSGLDLPSTVHLHLHLHQHLHLHWKAEPRIPEK